MTSTSSLEYRTPSEVNLATTPHVNDPHSFPDYIRVIMVSSIKAPTRPRSLSDLPYDILHQISEEVLWNHIQCDEVILLRCASRRCSRSTDNARLKTDIPSRPTKSSKIQLHRTLLSAPYAAVSPWYAGKNEKRNHIPLLWTCKKIQRVIQELLYSYQVFHIHVAGLDTMGWRPLGQSLQTEFLKEYGYKIRNVMLLYQLNTFTKSTKMNQHGPNLPPGGFRESLGRLKSSGAAVEESTKELRKVVEMLTEGRETTILDFAHSISVTPAENSNPETPYPAWKLKLLEGALRPLAELAGWVAGTSETPVEHQFGNWDATFYGRGRDRRLKDFSNAMADSLILE